jgi:triosephosphate isomerase (TIM)
MRKGLIAANWKMHGQGATNAALISALNAGLTKQSDVDILVCPPSIYLEQIKALLAGSNILLGAQNIHSEESGAYTGEISAGMLKDVGCTHVILGHSERRELFRESDEFIAGKFAAAQTRGLIPILCVGETLVQREADETADIVLGQLEAVLQHAGVAAFGNAVIAYEPVWAIGTGLTASPEQAQEVHALIRNKIAEQDAGVARGIRLLYGGSVKAANAAELFAQPDIDGGLVGGASLIVEEFLGICSSYT